MTRFDRGGCVSVAMLWFVAVGFVYVRLRVPELIPGIKAAARSPRQVADEAREARQSSSGTTAAPASELPKPVSASAHEAAMKAQADGDAAEAKGAYVVAEDAYRRSDQIEPSSLRLWFNLARLYDKQGLDHDAILEYRKIVASSPTGYKMLLDDPGRLAHYGDLCSKFQFDGPAQRAYRHVIESADKPESTNEPPVKSSGASTEQLRAGAYMVAGLFSLRRHDVAAALDRFNVAAREDGTYWMPHFYLALAFKARGDKQIAEVELTEADDTADDKGKAFLHEFMAQQTPPNPVP